MLKNTVIYVDVLLFIFLDVLFGVHCLLPRWFPSLLGWRGSLDRDSKIAILKLISAKITFLC